jgi:serine/threonine protein phosphatase PrpC
MWLPFGYVRASAASRAAALAASRIEELDKPEGAATLIADGKETKGALPLETKLFGAAIYSSRGRGYARYNEDAGGLFADQAGQIYAFVLDQAGGLGGRVRGKASAIAAARLYQACRNLAVGPKRPAAGSPEEEKLLLDAYLDAHQQLVARGEGEVTTAVLAVARRDAIIVVNSGDSGAFVLDKTGQVKARTEMQELGPPHSGCLGHAIGLVPEGAAPEVYRWNVEPGDWLVMATDGLLDSGLSEAQLGAIFARATDPEDAVNRLCTTVLRRMATFRGKPDNLTVVAARVLG